MELVEGRGDFDLIILDDPWTSEFLPAGFLENLDPWFESTGKKLSDDFIASLLALGSWPYPEGSQYALPIVGNVQLFAYRRDLFEAHGLSIRRQLGLTWLQLQRSSPLMAMHSG